MFKTLNIILLLTLFLVSNHAQASYCYQQDTYVNFELIAEGDDVYVGETNRDNNRVSYISQDKFKLEGIRSLNLEVIADQDDNVLFSNEDGYYLMRKDGYLLRKYGVVKVCEKSEVQKAASPNLLLINGQWQFVQANHYSEEVSKVAIGNKSNDLEVLANYNRGELLLKDDKSVYVYFINTNKLEQIPKLMASQIVFLESDDFYGNHFLYDDDTFYLIGIRFDYTDITSHFVMQGKSKGLRNAALNVTNRVISMDTKDGFLWLYLSGGITLANEETVNFHPIKATYLNEEKKILMRNDKLYLNSWDAVYERSSIDVSDIDDYQSLKDFYPSFYATSKEVYTLEYGSKRFRKLDWLTPKAVFHAHKGVDKAHFFTENNSILYYDNNSKELMLKEDKTDKFKELKIACAYDGKMLIEGKSIENIANEGDLILLGSAVEVIRACDDGGRSGLNVEVDYYYFFADKQNVYAYKSGTDSMVKMEDLLPRNFVVDNYTQIMQLKVICQTI